MAKVWELFENLNDFVNVVNIDNCEIVYFNKKMREKYGFSSNHDVAGKKCFEVIQNSSRPCASCNLEELEVGSFREWCEYNPILKKHFVYKNTMIEDEGRRLRMEFAFDASSFDWQHNSYQNLEAIVNEGLRQALMEPTPDRSIAVVLEYVGKALQGERTYIFERNEKGGDDNTYEWVALGITSEKENLQNLPPEICANWYNSFTENKNVVIKNLEDIREDDPLQYETLKRQDIHSLVVVPLCECGRAIGFYGVDNPPAESYEYATNMLQIMGHFIVSSLKRRNLVRKLETMSFNDQLTKLGNRHAMKDFLEKEIKEDECIAVVYGDLTGLKSINDRDGHGAGDKYIISAAGCMEKTFGRFGVFRIGGDEFLVLRPGISRRELAERTKVLKRYLEDDSVVMAIGTAWNEDGFHVQSVINEAEALMYKDKAEYYKRMGIDRRRR